MISRYENADSEPRLSDLQAIADATGVSLIELLGIEVSPQDLVRALLDHPKTCANPGQCESCQAVRGIVVGVLMPDGQLDD